MKKHSAIGGEILASSTEEIIDTARQIALTHHERWDGNGYPDGLSGEEIPLAGRIVGLVDVFEALCSKRPYKEPYPMEVVLGIIRKERGRQFDPGMVDVFLENIDGFLELRGGASPEESEPSPPFCWSERDRKEMEEP